MTANEILEIIRAFFQAILNVLKALGINFGDKEADADKKSGSDATPTNGE